jgi:cyclic beta-1,2-glucan synthetase
MNDNVQVSDISVVDNGAQTLAHSHRVTDQKSEEVAVFRDLGSITGWLEKVDAYCRKPDPDAVRAADWYLDNDYQIIRAVRAVQEGLPRNFYNRLTALSQEQQAATPRVFALAYAITEAVRPQMTLREIVRFVSDYQEVSPLTIAELWALPSMLNLVSLENLIDSFEQIDSALAAPFKVSTLATTMQTRDPIDRIAASITNLAVVHSIKWKDFVDQTSCMEAVLGRDPSGVYRHMNFDTRDRYRKAVESLSERSNFSEMEVAGAALELAQASSEARKNHIGYWLIDEGHHLLQSTVSYRSGFRERFNSAAGRQARPLYFSALLLGVLAALIVPVIYLFSNYTDLWHWFVGLALSLLPATVLSVTIVHWLATKLVAPNTLPEMDFSQKISQDCPTAVVVPVIFKHASEISSVMETLEVRRLANPDPMLRFVILSDLADAPSCTMPEDVEIEFKLRAEIDRLNERYNPGTDGPFMLMHRARQFNPAENCWMGWERKRGKLLQFNRFVLGEEEESFSLREGGCDSLRGTRFVIVLDADTELPSGAAARLVGILAHPLNHAQFDETTERVTAGYTIVQPRIDILPKGGSGTLFSHLYSGDTAIDIYSRAVSDVYQDLFGSGVFIGKGIYDVASVEKSLSGRVPENAILSHDLFEGIHGRAALASNVVLYEDFPPTYSEYALRLHRWVRGDWQLLPWLRLHVPSASGERLNNNLASLDRWKILDNLRRSLISPSLLLFFVGAWMILPGSAIIWTLLAVAAPGSYLIGEIYAVATGGVRQGFWGDLIHRFTERGGRWFLAIVFLVSDTLITVDAVLRTLWRVLASRKNLLEWKSAAHTSAQVAGDNIRRRTWRMMWASTAFSAVLTADLALYNASALLPAAPVLLLWFLAPEIAIWTARPRQVRQETLDDDQKIFLRHIARRTWHFFETFTGPDDNWLPPDNFQEDLKSIIAHRTSPTNIGMFLVSALSARDFGFITNNDFLARSRNTLDTLERMKSYRGHILNWYDTQSLEPLEPQYVSTVDSGNLAITLVALKQGCLELENSSALDPRCWNGLSDTLDLLLIALRRQSGTDDADLNIQERAIRELIFDASASPMRWSELLGELQSDRWPAFEHTMGAILERADDMSHEVSNEIHVWLDRFNHHVHAMQRDFEFHFPWTARLDAPPESVQSLANAFRHRLTPGFSGREILVNIQTCMQDIETYRMSSGLSEDASKWLLAVEDDLTDGADRHQEMVSQFDALAKRAGKFAFEMDFTFLYNPEVRLFSIGYNVSSGRLDPSHYDLLATEARLASFFALAKHDAPLEHWYFFNRPITRLAGKPSILSWNGSMFEYLMPPLFLPSNRDTLLGESEITAVDYQRRYAKQRGVPWGISESAFGVTDAEGNYQYRAFGVPGLGIRRGLTDDLVIAPYASALALCAWPAASAENLQALEKLGSVTVYGFWDALDFTPGRALDKERFLPVKTYMAHHQGMIIAAISNVLHNDILVDRVLREKPLKAIDLLLHERVPWELPIEKGRIDETWEHHEEQSMVTIPAPWIPSSHSSVPQLHILGNGRLSTIVSESGGGGLSWQGNALTRWLPDPTRDCHGYWLYIQDPEQGELWSLGRQPTGKISSDQKTIFHQHMVETFRRDYGIATRMETTIAPFDDVEIRRVSVSNDGGSTRTINLTSYAEIVLAPSLDDERHPAFSKLFVGATFLPKEDGLLFERRPRRPEDQPPVLLHNLVTNDPSIQITTFETDRARFVGRNGNLKAPRGLRDGLTRATGWTLDPIMALQISLTLKSGETKQFSILTFVGSSRGQVVQLARTYSVLTVDRAFRDAALETARKIERLEIDAAHLPEMQVLSSLLLQPSPALRLIENCHKKNPFGQPDLWRFGISGDLPILLMVMENVENSDLLETLIRAQRIWHGNGLRSDLVILRTGMAGYEEPLRERILSILRDTHAEGFLGRNGGIHLLSIDQMDGATRHGLEAASHIVLSDCSVSLSEKLDRLLDQPTPVQLFEPTLLAQYRGIEAPQKPKALAFENGYGGFDVEAGEYVIRLEADQHTPAPWCNVLANDQYGTLVSESGLGFTWAINSGEHRLTPWSNDPVANTPGEVLYLRDEITAKVWSVTPTPLGHGETCQVRHGKGYTVWTQNSQELEQELLAFVPTDDPVKIVRLRLKNRSESERRITATYYAEWLLGALGSASKPHVICRYDPASKSIVATTNWNPEFEGRTAFLAATIDPHSLSGNRHDFIGKEGDMAAPAGLGQWDLGNAFTPGGDACATYQVHLDIPVGETAEVVFLLGEVADTKSVEGMVERWKALGKVDEAFDELAEFWKSKLGAVQVKTPDPALDVMVNQWLPYQNLSCRIMARAAFYQAGGAYGFRDQLQDMLAVLSSDPQRVRDHILFAAHSQFQEGDVLHWWHPPAGRGVRTRCSDDYIWLVYVTARYVDATGDISILDVEVPFLRAAELRPEEGDRYARFDPGETGTLFDHCARALDHMMTTGTHGLPLIGTGDWNDGMDRVGNEGRGESVWLAWFQTAAVHLFSPLASKRGEKESVNRWQRHTKALQTAVNENGWDGDWFVRAFDDEGEPWGAKSNSECQIDSLAQSWSVLSGAPITERQTTAMASAAKRLIRYDDRLIQLLDPPFQNSARDPGYIQAYPAGVRENGGQYTHAAAWLGLAFAKLDDGDMAWRIFDIINPIRRVSNKQEAQLYLREPYVLAGDVSGGDKAGQGGWSWYTGAAGWTWQLAVEGILGVTVKNTMVHLDPSIPSDWGEAQIVVQNARGTLSIEIRDSQNAGSGVSWIEVDGKRVKGQAVRFPGKGKKRYAVVQLGKSGKERT